MRYTSITIKREDLYEEVWATPISHLAKKYHLSDVGLAKVCKRMQVPRPGRGYWAQVKNGAKVKRKALSKLSKAGQSQVIIRYRNDAEKEAAQMSPVIQAAKELSPVKANDRLHDPHPLVEKTRKFLENTKPEENGLLVPQQKRSLNIKVSKNQTQRALCILDAVITQLEHLGHEVQVIEDGKHRYSCAFINKRQVRFSLEEKTHRIEHVWTQKELQLKEKAENKSLPHNQQASLRFQLSWVPKYDSAPSGKLTFALDEPSWCITRRTWSDGHVQRLEECINAIVIGVVQAAENLKAEELEWQRKKEEQERAWERSEKLKALQEAEKNKVDALTRSADDWQQSQKIRAFLSEVEKKFSHSEPIQEQLDWLKWAKDYADHIDPLTASEYRKPSLKESESTEPS